MSHTIQSVINAAADEADSLLDGVASPAEAKPMILEWLADNYPDLPPDQRHAAVRGIVSVLDREGFFDTHAQANSTDEGEDFGEADE